jgi:anaerobic ribonucleoside-triphosphate reductase
LVTEVIKRDGNIEEFKPYKIDNVIELAFNNVNESYDHSVFDNVLKILKKSESKVSVEHIQDIVETQLYKKKHFEVLKSFIEYRQTHKVQRFLKKDKTTFVDCNQTIDEYVDKVDWRILANSNTGYSHAGLVNNTAGKVIANYWLDKVYSPEEAKAHRDGDYHIHDLDNLSGYCAGWSLRALLDEGFNGVRGRVDADAPNHLSSALGQMVNFLGILQSEWAGAQAFSSFDTYLAPYLFKDCLTDEQLYKEMQSFVYNLNVPSRWGQSPFTNVTIDVTVPEDLKNQIPTRKQRHIFSDIDANSDLGKKLLKECKKRGKEKLIDMTYSDFQPELERIDIAFYRVLTEGDLHSQPFTFPIPTVNITEDFDWDSKAATAIFENAAKMGSSYFQNFIGSQYIINEKGERVPNEKAYKPGAVRSMCCRLQLDLRELLKRGGGLFGSAEMTGSIAVVTINLARLGYLFKGDSEGLYKRLDYLMDLAKSTLEKKRKVIQELFDRGLFPYTKRYLPGFNNHFSTIGVNGANEMIRNFTNDKESIVTEFGQKFAYDLLEHMRTRIRSYQEETGKLFNLEFSPAEGATYRFAKEDLKRYPDILQAGFGENIYYTNSIQIPANYTDDIFEALELNDDLQILATGGTVLHGYLQENLKSGNDAKNLVRKVITNFKLPYFTLTPVFSICPKHGYISGDHEFCPKCDAELLEQQNRSCGNDC